ncbi:MULTISPECIES: hypothetical protein [unclassified Nostoc]|uniref:hypothetical protein n=1 Tax=unclassified Nostoc TaxID=2593658 RepID=UPI002AD29AB8|nr:hypothetical protein [Nostoc sp. DedQUE03]MDZ7971888.1 hypothetical protein [Nostoc sp. DedQUE03]MDZ8046869.1 hypothetical protein [Nostoc sp. DedQUE02]
MFSSAMVCSNTFSTPNRLTRNSISESNKASAIASQTIYKVNIKYGALGLKPNALPPALDLLV